MISIRRVVLAAACLLAATAVDGGARRRVLLPSGPQVNVDKSQLEGWQQCFSGTYGDGTSQLAGVLDAMRQGTAAAGRRSDGQLDADRARRGAAGRRAL